MREIALQDTRTGALIALPERKVGVYACGPTVYGRIHIGNARPFVIFSLLKRFLEHEGRGATLVINITDINDKIYAAAVAAGVPSAGLAAEMTAAYLADTDGLRLGRPDHEPLASETIGPIIDLIAALVDRGHAYKTGGDVLFAVRSDPEYGSLSHRSIDDMDQGEGVEGADRKRDPQDFALWKATKEREDTAWDSPWGRGRPGWHIECSAMAEELLGLEFDIHGGGSDLVFPHHENEAAQTRAGRGRELARIWMHNGMLQTGAAGEKMAKSVGNIAPLHEVVEQWGRDAVVLLFASAHYRQPMQFGDESLEQARAAAQRIREAARGLHAGDSPPDMADLRERFFAALADDFNTPEALAALWDWIREANRRGGGVGGADLRAMLAVIGLERLMDPDDAAPPQIEALARERMQARAAGDFARADALRDEITAAGWVVRDSTEGFELTPAPR